MAIPAEVLTDAEAALTEFCQKHSSTDGADKLRYTHEFESSSALIIEQRPSFMKPEDWVSRPIAKFRYSQARNVWSLYWRDTSDRWHRVSNVPTAKDIRVLLDVVVKDPLGVFWS